MNSKDIHQAVNAYLRRDQILDGFYELLKNTAYEDITVSGLCEHIGVARKVFYKNYRDKRDCVCSLIDRFLTEAQLTTSRNVKTWALSMESATVIMECWKARREFLDMIVNNNFIDLMVERAVRLAITEDDTVRTLLERSDMPCDEYILATFLSCHFTLIFQWYSNGFDASIEEMARKYLRIAKHPMVSEFNNL